MTRVLRAPRQTVRLEDVLENHEPWYRSRGEAQIGRLLDRYGVPFAYEQALQFGAVENRRLYLPDFTILSHNATFAAESAPKVIEYLGMLDRADYRRCTIRKMRDYADHGVRALYVRPHELTGPRWQERLYRGITDRFDATYSGGGGGVSPDPAKSSARYRAAVSDR